MGSTTFGKPTDTEIAELSSNIQNKLSYIKCGVINSGTSKSYNVGNGKRFIIISISATESRCCIGIATTSSAGDVSYYLISGSYSALTVSGTNGVMTISTSNASGSAVYLLDFENAIA